MRNSWETTVRTAANMMLHYPDRISDGLEAELYALLEKLDTAKTEQPRARASGLTRRRTDVVGLDQVRISPPPCHPIGRHDSAGLDPEC